MSPTRLLTVLCLCAFALSAVAADWPNWRGPKHDGISPDKTVAAKWEQTPPQKWETEIGAGFSGMSVVGDKIYTGGTIEKKQVLLCLGATDGKILWKVELEDEYKDGQGGDGPRGTPTVADGRVYIQGGHGRVLCADAATGKEVWSRKYEAKPQWGYSGSILIEGDLAIVNGGNEDGPLVALNAKTGEPVWKAGEGKAGYATPYPFTFDGKRCVAGFLAKNLIVVDPKTGKELWSTEWTTDWDVNAATPIFHAGHLFLTSGYKTGAGLFKLAVNGEKLVGQAVWEGQPDKVVMGKFQSPVLYDGHLYVSDQKELKCVELMTGKEKWRQSGIKDGTVLLAGDQLVVLTEGGELQIAKASPEEYEPTTKVKVLDGRCWTVPTLVDGKLYVRNLKIARCYTLTK